MTIRPAQSVRHPAHREPGTIATLIYTFPVREPTHAWVDFPSIGKRRVRTRDLTPMPPPVVPAGLRLVEPSVA